MTMDQNDRLNQDNPNTEHVDESKVRLLAYALNEFNELTESERQAIQEQIEKDPETRDFVESMRQIGTDLEQALILDHPQPEPSGELQAVAKARIQQNSRRHLQHRIRFIQYGLAACLALGLSAIYFLPMVEQQMQTDDWSEEAPQQLATQQIESTSIGGVDTIEGQSVGQVAQQPAMIASDPEEKMSAEDLLIATDMVAFQTTSPPPVPKAEPANVPFENILASNTSSSSYRADRSRAGASVDTKPSMIQSESYETLSHNSFLKVARHPLSTFSIDVDTASYANVRRFLSQGQWPPAGAVRLEEMINYFNYQDAPPPTDSQHPFAVHTEVNKAPWHKTNRVVRIGIKGKVIDDDKRPSCNLVFLLDVSGSMRSPNKLPLVKQSMKLLLSTLNEDDRVAIVVYAGNSGLVLDSTPAGDRHRIMEAMNRLNAGGSTNGGAGIKLAYKIARENFITSGVNRVILATDGDFNVGTTNRSELVRLIEKNRESDVSLSILGFGMGNYKDDTMESLSNKGNGNYAYIDSIKEAQKALVDQASGTLITIAKDVKIQVEFNPAHIAAYRLLGYENRMLRKEDFNNDRIDAGDIGAGHHVTALYEVVPAGQPIPETQVDDLKYQKPVQNDQRAVRQSATTNPELLTVKLRYKQPDGDTSTKLEYPLIDPDEPFDQASQDFKFATAVATFGMILRHSPYRAEATIELARQLAESGLGEDQNGYRKELMQLLRTAQSLRPADD